MLGGGRFSCHDIQEVAGLMIRFINRWETHNQALLDPCFCGGMLGAGVA